ncbi:MAG: tetratricopeptide repeat protein [Terriglobia bacterium]
MAAQAPETPKATREYKERWQAIHQLIREDSSWSGRERGVFYLNLGDGRFVDLSGVTGLDFPEDGRAFAILDLDNDGDLDLILKNRNAPQLRILRNDTPTDNHSIAFRLLGRESNPSTALRTSPSTRQGGFRTSREAVGARIELETPQGKRVKEVQLGKGWLSQASLTVYFGLGTSTGTLRATITWPSGREQTLTDLPADHRITLVEGDSNWQATPFRPRNFDLSSCPPQQPLKPGVKAEGYPFLERVPTPNFALKNLAGDTITSASLYGRPLLLNFWATWCVPCQQEMRLWKEHYAELRAAGTAIVAVSVDEPDDRGKVEQFVRQRQLPFPVLLMDAETLRRYDIFYRGLFYRSTGLQIPTTFLLDAQGQLVKLYRGLVPLETLQADLRTLRETPQKLAQAALPYPGRALARKFTRDFAHLGLAFIGREWLADAALYFEKQVELHPNDAVSWNFLGTIYVRQDQPQRARQAFERSVRLRPDYLTSQYNLGMLYLVLNQPQMAEKALARATQNDPSDPPAVLQYGKVLIMNGKLEAAKAAFQAYLKLEPDHAEAHNTLGILYAKTGMPALAQESFARAVELKPDFAEAYKNQGTAYMQIGIVSRAVDALERAVELQPDDADAYYLLAYAYMQAQRTAEAKQALQKVLELRPNDSRARQTLEQLRGSSAGEPP